MEIQKGQGYFKHVAKDLLLNAEAGSSYRRVALLYRPSPSI